MRTFSHALLARIVSVLLFSLLVQAPILESRESAPLPPRPPQSFGRPGFLIQIQSALNPEPRIILTNLSEEPLTAVYLQMYSSTENRKRSGELWDAFLQNRSPLAKDVGISLSLSHAVGERIPDKVEVAAAIWADGTTFGPPDQLKRILSNRASRAAVLDGLVSFLQTGLQQEWTREQYLAALDQAPTVSSQAYGLRSTLNANPNLDTKPRVRQKVIQRFIDSFSAEREVLRQSKPDISTPYNPA